MVRQADTNTIPNPPVSMQQATDDKGPTEHTFLELLQAWKLDEFHNKSKEPEAFNADTGLFIFDHHVAKLTMSKH